MAGTMVDVNIGIYSQVVDDLRRLERQGKGTLLELCTVEVGSEICPVYAFQTPGEPVVVVTARHCACAGLATDKTVYRLIEKGVRGLTLVPVCDLEGFCKVQPWVARWLEMPDKYKAALYMKEGLVGGIKRPPVKGPTIKTWDDFHYFGCHPLPLTAAVQRLIRSDRGLVDLENVAASGYALVTKSKRATGMERKLLDRLCRIVTSKGYELHDGPLGLEFERIAPGLFEWTGRDSVLDFAAEERKLGISIQVPTTADRGNTAELADPEHLLDVNVLLISAVVRALRSKKKVGKGSQAT